METNPPSATPAPSPSPAPAGKSKLFKWLKIGGIVVVLLIVLVAIAIKPVVTSILRSQIQAAVASSLNATVEMDEVTWHPLLGVSIGHARLISNDGKKTPIAELTSLDTNLASIPSGGPLEVGEFKLINPTVNLIAQPDGTIVMQPNLVKPSEKPAAPSSKKFSEMIHVVHFEVQDLTVHVIDAQNPSAATTAWVHVNVEGISTGAADYDVTVDLNEKPLTQMKLTTSINIDGPGITFRNFSLNVQAPSEQDLGQLPPRMAEIIRQKGVSGGSLTVSLADGASIVSDPAKGHWTIKGLSGKIQLASPKAKPLADGAIAFDIDGGGSMPTGAVKSPLDYLAALDPDTKVSIRTDSEVKLTNGLPQPVTGGAFDFEYFNNAVTLKSFDAKYGAQTLHMDLAAALASGKLSLKNFHLGVAGGTVVVSAAELNLTAPYNYSAGLTFDNVQLSDVKDLIQLTSQPHLAGLASGKLNVRGTLPPGVDPLTTVEGDGEAHVVKGDFWDIRFLGDIAQKVIPNFVASATQVGDADVVYTLGNSQMHLSKMQVGSPILGISGTGDIGLVADNQLNLLVNAQPLGDWQKQLNGTGIGNIPGLDAIGKAAGQAQGTLNKVTSGALGLKVTGPAAHPTILPAAAGAIGDATKGAADDVTKGAGDAAKGLLDLFGNKKKK